MRALHVHDCIDVIIIGEGIAGLTAAGALAKHGLSAATFEQQIFAAWSSTSTNLIPHRPAAKPAAPRSPPK